VLVCTSIVVCPLLFVPSDLGKIDRPLRVLGPITALCEMRPLWYDQPICERKAKKDAPAVVVSCAACVSELRRLIPADWPCQVGSGQLGLNYDRDAYKWCAQNSFSHFLEIFTL